MAAPKPDVVPRIYASDSAGHTLYGIPWTTILRWLGFSPPVMRPILMGPTPHTKLRSCWVHPVIHVMVHRYAGKDGRWVYAVSTGDGVRLIGDHLRGAYVYLRGLIDVGLVWNVPCRDIAAGAPGAKPSERYLAAHEYALSGVWAEDSDVPDGRSPAVRYLAELRDRRAAYLRSRRMGPPPVPQPVR